MENKKYEITTNELVLDGRKFFQVKALKDFGSVVAGKLGGYVEGEHNLSQEGTCWIDQGVIVIDNACVTHDAYVSGNSSIRGNAQVRNRAFVRNATVCDNAVVEGASRVVGGHHDYNSIVIKDDAVVSGSHHGSFVICGNANIKGNIENYSDRWIGTDVSGVDQLVAYPAPKGTEYGYHADIITYTNKDVWAFRNEENVIELTSREIDSLLPELVGPKFATYMQFIRDAHHSIYDIELFEGDFE